MAQTLSETLFKDLELSLNSHDENSRNFSLLYEHCFKILEMEGDNHLENVLKYYFDEYIKQIAVDKDADMWFVSFHKMIRQADLYSSCSVDIPIPLEPEEEKRYNELFEKIRKTKDASDNEKEEYKKLNRKRLQTDRESINGHLDMIIYNLVRVDNNFLFKTLRRTYKTYNNILLGIEDEDVF